MPHAASAFKSAFDSDYPRTSRFWTIQKDFRRIWSPTKKGAKTRFFHSTSEHQMLLLFNTLLSGLLPALFPFWIHVYTASGTMFHEIWPKDAVAARGRIFEKYGFWWRYAWFSRFDQWNREDYGDPGLSLALDLHILGFRSNRFREGGNVMVPSRIHDPR